MSMLLISAPLASRAQDETIVVTDSGQTSKEGPRLGFQVHSVGVLRTRPSSIPLTIRIENLETTDLVFLSGVHVVDHAGSIIQAFDVTAAIKPTGTLRHKRDLVHRQIATAPPERLEELGRQYHDLGRQIHQRILNWHLELDIQALLSQLQAGDELELMISAEFQAHSTPYRVKTRLQFPVSEPLPIPISSITVTESLLRRSRNSKDKTPFPPPPGWYVGDQHVHSGYGPVTFDCTPLCLIPFNPIPYPVCLDYCNDIAAFESPDPLPSMAVAAQAAGLNWTIFTDHSVAFSSSAEWEQGYDDCQQQSNSTYKCLYGQELSLGNTGWCDALGNGHYLAVPFTDDHLGWIDGDCELPIVGNDCDCRPEQEVMDEVQYAGGMGFIAHPYYPDEGFTSYAWDDWSVTGMSGLEILHKGFSADDALTINNPDTAINSWVEYLLDEDSPNNGFMVGIGDSDAHYTDAFTTAFTYCFLANSLSTTSIRTALKEGHCVASSGPFLEFTINGAIVGEIADVVAGPTSLNVLAQTNAEFGNLSQLRIYVDDEPQSPTPLTGTEFSDPIVVTLAPTNRFVRLEVLTTSGHIAISNPIWLHFIPNPCDSFSCTPWKANQCGGGACAAHQRLYTRSCTPEGCADQVACLYDPNCVDDEPPPDDPDPTDCTEPGYEFCSEYTPEGCSVSIALNMYSNVNDIRWGTVVDSSDPYVLSEYRIGWTNADAQAMYYACNCNEECDNACDYGGCTCESLPDTGTRVTVRAPGLAHHDGILGYNQTPDLACWLWYGPFHPNYGASNPIYVLRCYDDADCSDGFRCDKSGSWDSWACLRKTEDGGQCVTASDCLSNSCDNDGAGLLDDGWCFEAQGPFDGQEPGTCEYSTGSGSAYCDERTPGSLLGFCEGKSYWEEMCDGACSPVDNSAVFRCVGLGCACEEPLCDGQVPGAPIVSCSAGMPFLADECSPTAAGVDQSDGICRSANFAAGCTADPACNGILAGTGNCSAICSLTSCGDGTCGAGESCITCPADCAYPASCGNGICESECEESSDNCQIDCGECCTPYDMNYNGFVSIIGDVPPFVDCVYFGDCACPGCGCLCPADCNGSGYLSIVGDVQCFVNCVYFGECSEGAGLSQPKVNAETILVGGAVYTDFTAPLASGLENVTIYLIPLQQTAAPIKPGALEDHTDSRERAQAVSGHGMRIAKTGPLGLWSITNVPPGVYQVVPIMDGKRFHRIASGVNIGQAAAILVVDDQHGAALESLQFLAVSKD